MAATRRKERPEAVRDAMNRVLAAERSAQAAVEGARENARAELSGARDEVHRIELNARLRIGRVNEICEQRARERAAELREAAGLAGHDSGRADEESELIREACRRLAAALTGGS